MRVCILLCLLSFTLLVSAHEGHRGKKEPKAENVEAMGIDGEEERSQTWTQWAGSFHLIFLHYPIALISMLAVSELLLALRKLPIFEYASRFLLTAAAILTVPTALLGLLYSYKAAYAGLMEAFLLWHMNLGIFTAVFVIVVALLRKWKGLSRTYYACLAILFLLVNITAFFGGGMTFGPYMLLPP